MSGWAWLALLGLLVTYPIWSRAWNGWVSIREIERSRDHSDDCVDD